MPAANEENGKCATAEYKLDGDIVKVKNTHVIDGVQKFIEGTAKFADDANGTGKVIVSFSFGGNFFFYVMGLATPPQPYLILSADLALNSVYVPKKNN